jgi:hypothetical protein
MAVQRYEEGKGRFLWQAYKHDLLLSRGIRCMVLFSIVKDMSCCNFFALAGLSSMAVERNSSFPSSTKAGKHSFPALQRGVIGVKSATLFSDRIVT